MLNHSFFDRATKSDRFHVGQNSSWNSLLSYWLERKNQLTASSFLLLRARLFHKPSISNFQSVIFYELILNQVAILGNSSQK